MGYLNRDCELVNKAMKVVKNTTDIETLEDRMKKALLVVRALESKKLELLSVK